MRRVILLVPLLVPIGLVLLGSQLAVARDATPAASPSAGCPTATEAENAAVARRLFDEALNAGDLDVIDEIVAADASFHWATFPTAQGAAEDKRLLGAVLAGFPDVRFTMDQVIAGGDLVVVRWTATGTHLGEFQGIAPTGREITWTGIDIYRIACGRIVEGWAEVDGLGRMAQLTGATGAVGAAPPDAMPVTG